MNTSSDTGKLIERINRNKESQDFSLEDWIFSDLRLDECNSILELCSGTGRQSERIVTLAGDDTRVVLSDISDQACLLLKEKFAGRGNVSVINDDIDKLLCSIQGTFDFIFVSYGLYYSQLREEILCEKITRLLADGGRLIVVGPFTGNNTELFGFLSSLNVRIPRSVVYSCEDFMNNVLYEMSHYASRTTIDFVANLQVWTSVESLMSYWKSSTFYDSDLESKVQENLEDYFKRNGSFPVTKKIARMIFTKRHE